MAELHNEGQTYETLKDDIFELTKQLQDLNDEAYEIYKPQNDYIVEQFKKKQILTKNSLEHFFDRITSFDDLRFEEMFLELCDMYENIYPDSVKFYRESFFNDNEDFEEESLCVVETEGSGNE